MPCIRRTSPETLRRFVAKRRLLVAAVHKGVAGRRSVAKPSGRVAKQRTPGSI